MTPEQLKLSELSAQSTLESIGLTRERILVMTGREVRPARVFVDLVAPKKLRAENTDHVPFPTTWEGRHKAAVKAVEMVRAGEVEFAAAALISVGLSDNYSTALHQCLRGEGALLDEARNAESLARCRGSNFCRWFLNLQPESRQNDPDNERLRTALKRCGISPTEVAAEARVTRTTITSFIRGKSKGMSPQMRETVWAVIKSKS